MKFYLSSDEKLVLSNKYKSQGLTVEEANFKLRSVSCQLNNLVCDLNKIKKSERYIQNKFNEEFAKLISKY